MVSINEQISFEILGHEFEALLGETSAGLATWRFPLIGGYECAPLSETLPMSVFVEKNEFQYKQVLRRRSTQSNPMFKPFHRTREVKTTCVLGGQLFLIHTRVTVKKNGQWYFWFLASEKRDDNPVAGGHEGNLYGAEDPWKAIENTFKGRN